MLTVGEGGAIRQVGRVETTGNVVESLAGELPVARSKQLDRNQILFCTGEVPTKSFLVTSGVFELMHTSPDGEQVTIGLAVAGELIGLAAWWRMGRHPYDAMATVSSSALPIEAACFENPGPRLRELCERSSRVRLRGVSAAWRMSRMFDSRTRLAFRLTETAMGFWDGESPECEIPFRLTQSTLGRMCGMRRETVNRLMQEFRRMGFIDTRPGGGLIVRVEKVAQAYDW